MVTVLIITLIIAQLISFYFIILLNTKVAKFKDLEVRQTQLIREMDDAISVYLLEIREENDRLIKELTKTKTFSEKQEKVFDERNELLDEEKVESKLVVENDQQNEFNIEQIRMIPKKMVTHAYNQQATKTNSLSKNNVQFEKKGKENNDVLSNSFEQKVITLYHEGKSIEEIAKITQKGITEIELLLKFHA